MYSFGLPKSLCISLVLNGSKKQNPRQLLVSIDFLDTKYIFVNQLYKSLFVFRDFNRGIVKQIDRALKTSDLTQQVCAMSLCKVLVIRKLAETLNMLSIWHHNQKNINRVYSSAREASRYWARKHMDIFFFGLKLDFN